MASPRPFLFLAFFVLSGAAVSLANTDIDTIEIRQVSARAIARGLRESALYREVSAKFPDLPHLIVYEGRQEFMDYMQVGTEPEKKARPGHFPAVPQGIFAWKQIEYMDHTDVNLKTSTLAVIQEDLKSHPELILKDYKGSLIIHDREVAENTD